MLPAWLMNLGTCYVSCAMERISERRGVLGIWRKHHTNSNKVIIMGNHAMMLYVIIGSTMNQNHLRDCCLMILVIWELLYNIVLVQVYCQDAVLKSPSIAMSLIFYSKTRDVMLNINQGKCIARVTFRLTLMRISSSITTNLEKDASLFFLFICIAVFVSLLSRITLTKDHFVVASMKYLCLKL